MINYLVQFMPDVSAFTSPLSGMSRMRVWTWGPLHEKCFASLKSIACKSPILKPIDYDQTKEYGEKIYLICDASIAGVGSFDGQGVDWQTCRPAGFLSKKFSSAQHSYHTYEQETLAILKGLLRWEDKLLGREIVIITDHRTLEFFNTQRSMLLRQIRWYEYLSRFNYSIQYVEGIKNIVADALLRMYAGWNESIPIDDWVNADVRLDPKGETLLIDRLLKSRAMQLRPHGPGSAILKEHVEPQVSEALELQRASPLQPIEAPETPARIDDGNPRMSTDAPEARPPASHKQNERLERVDHEEDLAWLAGSLSTPLEVHLEGDDFLAVIREAYGKDTLFSKVLLHPEQHPRFTVKNGIIYTENAIGNMVVAVLGALSKGRRVTEIAIDQAHRIVGHKAARKTRDYVSRWFWWPMLAKDVELFCKSCGICQTTKTSTAKLKGLLHSLPIPEAPCQSIAMDFVGPFPECMGHDYLLVVICLLTSLVHLTPTNTSAKATDIAWLFLRDIVRIHGLPKTIVSDRDPKFMSKFWRKLHRLMGVKLLMSMAYHPQTDAMGERAIRGVSQVLRSVVTHDQSDWVNRIPMAEFAINSSINDSTGFAPFELTYGAMPRIFQTTVSTPFSGVKSFAEKALTNIAIAHDSIIANRTFQTHYANDNQSAEEPLKEGNLVYLSTKNLNLLKHRAWKLMPTFIGPYPIVKANPGTSNYTLKLPIELEAWNIHPTFHVSLLKPHVPNDDNWFPSRDVQVYYDFGYGDKAEQEVAEILAHQWDGRKLRLLVKWNSGDSTWEPLKSCDKLLALDEYLSIRGVTRPSQLSWYKK